MSVIFPVRVTNAKIIRTGYPWLPRKATGSSAGRN